MQFDKETLIKHRFWIATGTFTLFWLITVILIKTSAADAGETAKKAFDTAKGNIKSAANKPPRNDKFNAPWNEYRDKFLSQKNSVWGEAWKVQENMSDWPSNETARLDRLRYYDEKVDYLQRIEYKDLWAKQFEPYANMIAPVEIPGGYESLMMPVGGGGALNAAFWRNTPTEEEMWLAQEDFWVKRELLAIVKAAVDNVARFASVAFDATKEPALPANTTRYRFRNNLWEIDLLIEQQPGRSGSISERSTIKNLHPAHRVASLAANSSSRGLKFKLAQGNRTFPFQIDGEPLPYGESATFRSRFPDVASINFKKPFELYQDFEWANCPIRQLIDIRLGKHSHRTANQALVPSLVRKPAAADGAAPVTAAAPAGGAMPPGGVTMPPMGAMPPGAPGVPGGANAAAASVDVTPNGFERNRYIFSTEQVRTMPVALHLVVDQSHLHEVLVAMSNSRLRVQTTQVEFRHIDGIRSLAGEPGSPPSGGPPAGAFGGARGGRGARGGEGREGGDGAGMGAGGRGMPPGGRGMPPGGGTSATAAVPANDDDPNLIELAVYGLASLYERYPPKNPSPAPATTSTPPATAATTPATPTAAPPPPPKTPDTGKSAAPAAPATPGPDAGKSAPPANKPAEKGPEKPQEKGPEKPQEKGSEKPPEKAPEKPPEKGPPPGKGGGR